MTLRKNNPMIAQTRICYRDFITGRLHYTRRQFLEWQRGGVLNAWGAVFVSRCGAMFIPVYLLTKESRALLPPPPIPEEKENNHVIRTLFLSGLRSHARPRS